jgi:DNA-binding response OmpR family regulator
VSRILVVEDNTALGKMLLRALQRAGHQVLLAGTGAEALRLLSEHEPEVVLLDLHLPDTDAAGLARKIRRRAKGVRIVGLSGDKAPPATRKLLDDFLLKPAPLAAVLQAVSP